MWRHNIVANGPIWTKFGRQMRNNMYTEAAWRALWKMPKLASIHASKTANINEKTWQFTTSYKDDGSKFTKLKQQNITKDYITSQHSDISAMCCEVISSSVIFAVLVLQLCCRRPCKLSSFFINMIHGRYAIGKRRMWMKMQCIVMKIENGCHSAIWVESTQNLTSSSQNSGP